METLTTLDGWGRREPGWAAAGPGSQVSCSKVTSSRAFSAKVPVGKDRDDVGPPRHLLGVWGKGCRTSSTKLSRMVFYLDFSE